MLPCWSNTFSNAQLRTFIRQRGRFATNSVSLPCSRDRRVRFSAKEAPLKVHTVRMERYLISQCLCSNFPITHPGISSPFSTVAQCSARRSLKSLDSSGSSVSEWDASKLMGTVLMTFTAGAFVGNEVFKEWIRPPPLDPREIDHVIPSQHFDGNDGTLKLIAALPVDGKAGVMAVNESAVKLKQRKALETRKIRKDSSACSAGTSMGKPMATSAMKTASSTMAKPMATSAMKTASSTHMVTPQELVASTSIKSTFRPYDVSARALKGNRLTMEDEYVISDGGRFVAVFDGHGGSGVSRYLRTVLYDRMRFFLGEEEEQQLEKETRRKLFPFLLSRTTPTIAERVAAIRSAFRSVDHEIMMDDRLHYQGSTAVAVVMHEGENGNRALLSANIGDSRAILSRKKKAVNLTRDHKPNDDREKARILSLGEEVEWDGHVYRVRNLSLSRAIGDRFAKPAISSEVEIKRFPVLENDDFVILASDGLWDVMSSQDAVNFVHKKLAAEISDISGNTASECWKRRHMSRFLAKEAIFRGSNDNVCVIIVWLKNDHKD